MTCEICRQKALFQPETPLKSSVHPSPTDESYFVPEKRVALAKVKSKIDRYRMVLYALETEQRVLESSLDILVYPVLTLPVEITSQIFLECLPQNGRVRPSPHAAPLLLAQICHHWRNIALSTCQLWSTVDISLSEFYPSQKHPWNSLERWFRRAKGVPLWL
ncbi:hypothetical protein C8R43DRAFT_872969, partial [Mycena crocata]